jgi:anti-anti-sigma factor
MWSSVEVILKNHVAELERLARHADSFVEYNNLDHELAFKVNLCFDELITNTISYGIKDQMQHAINVSMTLRADVLTVVLKDDGIEYDPFIQAPVPDAELALEDRKIGGWGVQLVKEFMDRVEYTREKGLNVITLVKRVKSSGGQTVEIKQEEVNDVTVLVPQARVDSNTAGDFEKTLVGVLNSGRTKLLIDFEDLDYISSAGLRVVLIGAKTCKAKGGKLILTGMKKHIREVFDVSGFTKILNILPSRQDGLAAF